MSEEMKTACRFPGYEMAFAENGDTVTDAPFLLEVVEVGKEIEIGWGDNPRRYLLFRMDDLQRAIKEFKSQ